MPDLKVTQSAFATAASGMSAAQQALRSALDSFRGPAELSADAFGYSGEDATIDQHYGDARRATIQGVEAAANSLEVLQNAFAVMASVYAQTDQNAANAAGGH